MPSPFDYPKGYVKDANDIEAEQSWTRIQKLQEESKKLDMEWEEDKNNARKAQDMKKHIKRRKKGPKS
jgi:hypothetical protein